DQEAQEEITRLLSEQAESDSARRGRAKIFAAITKGQVLGEESFVRLCMDKVRECASVRIRPPFTVKPSSLYNLFTPNLFRTRRK
ncbi:MAG: hypothetical protein LAT58_10870, partial [Opitutales bacterium]|nr:hypothetical protein [Opitutales bacterium]